MLLDLHAGALKQLMFPHDAAAVNAWYRAQLLQHHADVDAAGMPFTFTSMPESMADTPLSGPASTGVHARAFEKGAALTMQVREASTDLP